MIKKWLISIFSALLVFSSGINVISAQAAENITGVNASAALAIDADTGQILYQSNANQVLPVASISKLLAVLVIMDEIKTKQITWDTQVTISNEIAAVSTDTTLSNIALNAGQQYTVKQLVDAALIKSADGATLALSMMNGDTITSFNEKMQKKAKSIGVKDAEIYNAVGLQNKDLGSLKVTTQADEVENKMSALDVAKISQAIVKNYPELLSITAAKSAMFDTDEMVNMNEMLPGNETAMSNYVTDGLKTGTSDAAGESFAGTGTYQGHRIITVILHANEISRYTQTANLINYIIGKYNPVTVDSETSFDKATTLTVPSGKNKKLATSFVGQTTLWLTKGTKLKDLAYQVIEKKSQLKAPIKKNQLVGELSFTDKQLTFMNGSQLKIKLTAKVADAKANLIVRTWRAMFG